MLKDPESIKQIKAFGLNTYEVKIWIALLSQGTSTAGQLSDLANVPRSRSYDVLESLSKKGFISLIPGKPIKYEAITPKEVLDSVKSGIDEQTNSYISQINSKPFNDLINTLQNIHDNSSSSSDAVAAIIKGADNISKHLAYMCGNARKEIIASLENNQEPYVTILESVKQSNRHVRTIVVGSSENERKNVMFKDAKVPMRMVLIDEEYVVLFPISESEAHPEYDISIWIQNPVTAKFFKQLLV